MRTRALISRLALLCLAMCLFVPTSAFAIRLDKLVTGQNVTATSSGGNPASSSDVETDPSAIGNTRSIEVSSTGVVGSVQGQILDCPNPSGPPATVRCYSHSQTAFATGFSRLSYDGDTTPGISNSGGIGTVDFTEDGATAFRFTVFSFDYANSNPIDIVVFAYDVADPDKWSSATITLTQQTSFEEKTIPYTDFGLTPTEQGTNGPADFTSIGAFAIEIRGNSPDQDLTIGLIGTNGVCEHVPVDGFILDQCNECNGTDDCLDCLGVPFGTTLPGTPCDTGLLGECRFGHYGPNCNCLQDKLPTTETCDGLDNNCNGEIDENKDVCGICGGNGTSCLDCLGVPNGTNVLDQCGICAGDGTSCLDCAGTVNGTAKVDVCGVCGGDGTSCLDCLGVPFGTRVLDQCGVCAGDGKSCLDCAGVVNGSSKVDACGVCGGDGSSCKDCAGTVNGKAVVDRCGVCGGDGLSCIDCAGTLNGTMVVDRCGVCGGDGNTCLNCNSFEQTDELFELDQGAKRQERIVKKALRELRKVSKTKKTRNYIATTAKAAHELQLRNWFLSWQLPTVATECANTVFCTSTSNEDTIGEYTTHNDELLAILKDVLGKVATGRRKNDPLYKRILKRGKRFHKENLNRISSIPVNQSVCTG